jgi:hypothetical protein
LVAVAVAVVVLGLLAVLQVVVAAQVVAVEL